MCTADKEGKYSLVWARECVEAFQKKHARATEAINEKYQITSAMLAVWLVNHPTRWQNYKKTAKAVTIWVRLAEQDRPQESIRMADIIETNLKKLGIKPYQNL